MSEKDTPTVNLGKETRRDIASAIRDLSRQFRESRDEAKTRTFADNLAHNIAAGGSIRESVAEAASTSLEKGRESFKKAIDPVQIVKRMTGGSKLATVLAGRALGRNAHRIRASADIPQPMVSSPLGDTSPTPFTPESTSPSQVSGGGSETILRDMLKYMGMITLQVTSIADRLGAHGVARNKRGQFTEMAAPQYKMLKEIKNLLILDHKDDKKFQKKELDLETQQTQLLKETEELRKQAAIEEERQNDFLRAQGHPDEASQSPQQLGLMRRGRSPFGTGGEGDKDPEESGPGIFSGMTGLITQGLGIAGAAAAGKKLLGAAGKAVRLPFKALGHVAAGAGKLLGSSVNTSKAAVSAIKTFAGASTKEAGALVAPASKLAAPLMAPTAKALIPAAAGAAAKGAKASIGGLVKKLMPNMMKKYGGKLAGSLIPGVGSFIGAGMTLNSLIKGDWIGAGLNAVGMIPYAGLATIPIQIARDIYADVYDGADPFTDPLRSKRMPELLASVQQQVGDWITSKEQSPTQVTEAVKKDETASGVTPIPTEAVAEGKGPKLGSEGMWEKFEREESGVLAPTESPVPTKVPGDGIMKLSQEMSPNRPMIRSDGSVQPGAPVIMNSNPVTNINNQITQKMSAPRNTESSFLSRQYLAGVYS